MHHIRKPLSRFVHCRAQGGTCRRTIWTVHGGGSGHKGNEVKHKWTVSNFRYLGKRTRSIQFKRRKRFPLDKLAEMRVKIEQDGTRENILYKKATDLMK